MKTKRRMIVFIFCILSQIIAYFQTQTCMAEIYNPPETNRELVTINSAWKFHKGDVTGAENPAFDDAGWTDIDIPHTWNNLDGQDGGTDYETGIGWYRKHFTMPASYSDRQIYLQFDGANLVTEVYVNGSYVGKHKGGYARFRIPVTDSINCGSDNVIAVKVQNWGWGESPLPPIRADYTFFGGIYRDVHFLMTDKLQIRALDYGGPGVYLTQTNVSSSSADLEITTKVFNNYAWGKDVTIKTIIADADDNIIKEISSTRSIGAESGYDFVQNTAINDPHLWNGRQDPYLYKAFVQVQDGADVIDIVEQPLGFRAFRLEPNEGFYLNDQPLDLHGVNRHQDRLDMGWAITNKERDEDFDLILEMGANTIRVAHYQQSQYWYDLCDANGLIVWAEIPLVDKVEKNDTFKNNAKQQLKELIRQNYNHPSVAFWGIGNETDNYDGPDIQDPYDLLTELNDLAKAEDPDRITVYANNLKGDDRNGIADAPGFNIYYGWYKGKIDLINDWLTNFHTNHPDLCISLSEYGAGASVYQHEENPSQPIYDGDWHPEEYQNKFHEEYWKALSETETPCVFAKWIWNMFDFASDRKSEGDTDGRNDKGLVTYDRQTKKDAFFFYKANWSPEKFVYITSRRARNRSNTDVGVKVYSNCATVELHVNGVSKGSKDAQDGEYGIFKWEGLNIGDGDVVEAVGTGGYADSIIWNEGAGPPSVTLTDVMAGGSQSGHPPDHSFDNDETTRWANTGTRSTAWIEYYFTETDVNKVSIKFYKGHTRTYPIKITVGNQVVFEGDTATTYDYWSKSFDPVYAGSLKVEMTGPNSDGHNWMSIYEIEICGQVPFGNGGNPWPIEDGARIEAENFDAGGEGTSYHDTSFGNNGEKYRGEDVDIQSCTDTGGGYNVGWNRDAEWLEYTVDVTGGTYDIEVRVAANNSNPGDLRITMDGDTLCTFPIPDTGGWQNWTTLTCSGVSLSSGPDQTLLLEMIGGRFNTNWIEFVEVPSPPNIALNKLTDCSNEPQPENGCSNTVDGNTSNRWSALPYPQSVAVDLEDIYSIDKVKVHPYKDRAYQYYVEVREKTEDSWSMVVDRSANTSGGSVLEDSFEATDARYMRLRVVGCHGASCSGNQWVAIREFEVFGALYGKVGCDFLYAVLCFWPKSV